MKETIHIIGSGFASLSAACYLAKQGSEVIVHEKNDNLGGRARQLKREGFTFDMGPSWYWMPDVFERFFGDFGKEVSDYYELSRLDPAYKVFFEDEAVTIGGSLEKITREFEGIEPGSGDILNRFIKKAGKNYEIAMTEIVYQPGISPLELVSASTIRRFRQFFNSIRKEVRQQFKNPKLLAIMEFPVLFLGAKPSDTPAFYNFMNYADFGLGTWHPKGGMYKVVEAMVSLAEGLGVQFRTNSELVKIVVEGKNIVGLEFNHGYETASLVVSGADYHHTESLLSQSFRQYSDSYWESRTFAPSSLLFYIGFDRKIEGMAHHNLFFDTSFDRHAAEIYDRPQWPSEPLFYANFPSMTDASVAPEGKEGGFFLIPLAPDLPDTPEVRDKYLKIILDRIEARTGLALGKHILFAHSFCVDDFKKEYNSYKGNAYGMANTLSQTAFLRPGLRSRKINNLFFTGQLTVPGPGVPPALISGKLVAELIHKKIKPTPYYEKNI